MDLQSDFPADRLAEAFAQHGTFPFPAAGLPLQSPRMQRHLELSRRWVGSPWPMLTASGYLRYQQDGNRRAYEQPYFQRRRRVGAAALAWAGSGDPAFAGDLADGLLLLCEESTWCLPAHSRPSGPHGPIGGLPKPGDGGFLDLFNCETALVVAEACQLAAPALDRLDPNLVPRARAEVRRRVTDPLLAGESPGWMNGANNWGAWCSTSVIVAAGFAYADDPGSWGRLVNRLLGVLDRYVAQQSPDGGCDEGVMYWCVSGANLIRALEEVRARTGGWADGWGKDPRLADIMRFPARMHLGRGTFPAFADSQPRIRILPVGDTTRAGDRIGAPELGALARLVADPGFDGDPDAPGIGDLLATQLRALAWGADGAAQTADGETADTWLPDLQVLVARAAGTALAAKAGHNDERHNHNDLGQFAIHRQGVPLVVDAGRGDYTAITFSERRYDLWWTRSAGHAVPMIDGQEQLPGRDRAARAVECSLAGDAAVLACDLAAAYPAALGLRSLVRRVRLHRTDGSVEVEDVIGLDRPAAYVLPLLTTAEPRPDGTGSWLVEHDGQRLRISAPGLAGTVEEQPLDETLRCNWSRLWRLTLRGDTAPGGRVQVRFDP